MTQTFGKHKMAAIMAFTGMAMRKVDEENDGDGPWITKQLMEKEPRSKPVPRTPDAPKQYPETRQIRRARERAMK
jgi:hypothetical protein